MISSDSLDKRGDRAVGAPSQPKREEGDHVRKYICVVLRSTNSTKTVPVFVKQFEIILQDHDQSFVERTEDWGVKNCSSPLKGNKRAQYTAIFCGLTRGAITALENNLKLDNDVMRFCCFRIKGKSFSTEESALAIARREKEALWNE